jgi:hypothetical protein
MTSATTESLHDYVRAAHRVWKSHGNLLPVTVLRTLANEGFEIAPIHVAFVTESLKLGIFRQLEDVVDWQCERQGGEFIDFSEIDTPALVGYSKCGGLLRWAESHGAGNQVGEICRSIKERFPCDAEAFLNFLTSGGAAA